ncbi:hypothetical protein [Aggregatibacter actinomycetemcomitans]|uniref:hypothetical protein n=1 Tax=Aggregatibacter actinomycetemcomitans TaxID=714 RepID=UPI00197C1A3E|nr:hypothetical protein [Aggregatibacter actinomycetemcomitans]MBN6064768.1 hypothetical protein [Aggregatibacter actinomycetemcomitans]MBN6070372.1 hypothetical protein [Aggregatibacter actinomycetemcomitans]MBN6081903.1 hypothetical protein [Aggregatibacter actinomycetemcomitans]MBN6084194.1 hypothetical protein [Aggregatibacter actinomycetemcomitans]
MQVKNYTKMIETKCPSCGSKVRLTTKLIMPMMGSLAAGYMIADAPEFFQTKNDVVLMYESMTACMKDNNDYAVREKHRDLCACALMKTYEDFKFFNTKKRFEENLENCL